MNNALITQLLEPIPGDDICGADVSFSAIFDEIREARRQDDPSLAQGDWKTEIKSAHWPRVRELAEEVLREQSKDLQVSAWYTEAMTRLQGFEGLAVGLAVLEGLVSDFWEFFYPSLDPNDHEERASKIEWVNRQLPLVIREVPLTDHSSGAYSWLKWEESRIVDNLGLKDPAAREKVVADGKLSGDMFDKAVQLSGRAFYERLHAHILDAAAAAASLEKCVDERFGRDAPSLKDLRQAIRGCEELVGKQRTRLGGGAQAMTTTASTSPPPGKDTPPMTTATPIAVGLIYNRTDAIRALRESAHYFRQNEPHSPAALLAERAANWAEMPLEKWLTAVIKDENTLGQLRELLDIKPQET